MKDLKIYILIAFSLLGLYLLIEYNKPRAINWSPTFDRTDKIPFGTYILYHELPQLFDAGVTPVRKSVYETLQSAQGANLLIISASVNISATDYSQMLLFMRKGHDIFIAANSLNSSLEDALKLSYQSEGTLFAKDSLTFQFVNPQLQPHKSYRFDRHMATQFFSKFDTLRTTVLGKNSKGKANFIRYTFGKGHLYLLASADFFSNYALLTTDGANYATNALSYLRPKAPLIYDDYQALGRYGERDILRVIFSNPSLKWAYYIMLTCLVLFVLYDMKRRQRIIPEADPMRNTSVDFIKVVSGLYYQQRDTSDIVHKKITYLLHFIRSNYRLQTGDLDSSFKEMLISRSGVQAEVIDYILQEIKEIQKGKYLSDAELIALNNYIEQFYAQSGIIWNKTFSGSVPI